MPTGGVDVIIGGETLSDVPNRVASIDWSRGRTSEFLQTDTGECTVLLNYTSGAIADMIGQDAQVVLYAPTGDSSPVFTGIVDDAEYVLHPSQKLTQVALTIVDAFDFFNGIEVVPGLYGENPLPPGVDKGNIFYEQSLPSVRINTAILEAAFGGPTEVFSGNVQLRDSIYARRTSLLTIMRDAADAEFPGVANLFVQRDGTFTFHGRLARFNPTDGQYNISFWQAGDRSAGLANPGRAQLRGLRMRSSRKSIINAALATPYGIEPDQVEDLIVTDPGSIFEYGTRSWSADGLLTLFDELTNLKAKLAVKQFAQYYVDNYAYPLPRISELMLRSISPGHPNAAATWSLMLHGEISDVVDVAVGASPGIGVGDEYFIEGVRGTVIPLNRDFADVTVNFDLSPRARWTTSF